jgi:hypothetical protein
MQVLTIQDYDLRTFTGPIDLNCGSYSHNQVIKDAQRKLYDLLKAVGRLTDDNVVWCDQDQPIMRDKGGRYLHEINADSRDVIAVIDSLAWCHIINYGPRFILPEDHCALRRQATTSGEEYGPALRRLEDMYLADNIPADLWSTVAKSTVAKKSDQVLLKFPFEFSTIVKVRLIAADPPMTEIFESSPLVTGPTFLISARGY